MREGYSNVRIGMFLEVATTTGAVAGAHLASQLPTSAIAVVFGVVLLASAVLTNRAPAKETGGGVDPLAARLKLVGDYPGPDGRPVAYAARHVPAGIRRLMVAILEDAMYVARKHRHAVTRDKRRLYFRARRWFESEDRTWVFSFLRITEALGIEPELVKRSLRASRRAAELSAS